MEQLDVRSIGRSLENFESIVVMPRVDSTLDLLSQVVRECAEAEQVTPPAILLAGEQLSGRGREKREWRSPAGKGLYASLSFRVSQVRASTMPLEIGLLAARIVESLGGEVELKWPNDLYVNGKKLGGILIRGRHVGDEVDVVAGIGINVHPVDEVETATSLSEILGKDVELDEVQREFVRLADEMLGADHDPATLVEEWKKRSLHREGDRVTFTAGGRELSGIWSGIDDAGHAILTIDGEKRELASGEIVEWFREETG